MADQGINHFGMGLGYIYVTNAGVTDFIAINPNTAAGVEVTRNIALKNAPLAANRSAVATIRVTAAASAGNLNSITVLGVNQIAAAVACTSSVLATVAQTWCNAINAFTPATGYDYTAGVQGDTIYLFAPEAAGSTVNGVTPVISTSVGSLTATATAFEGGSTNTGIYDDVLGYRYWLDADYGASGIAGSTPAAPNPALPFLYAIEITNDVTRRGLETGIYNEDATLSLDTMVVARKSSITEYHITNQASVASDYLVRITPVGFIEGDLVLLCNDNVAQTTTVCSPPNAESVSATANPNIFLTNYSNFDAARNNVILLQFHYDDIFGGIFREIGRSNPSSIVNINRNATIYVDSRYGDDTTGARDDFQFPFMTIDAALLVAQNGDTMVVSDGAYTATSQLLSKASFTLDLTSGTSISGDNILTSIGTNSRIVGSGTITTNAFYQSPNGVSIELNNFILGRAQLQGSANLTWNIKEKLTITDYIVFELGAHDLRLRWNKAEFTNASAIAGVQCILWRGNISAGSTAYVEGDVYITGNYTGGIRSDCGNSFHGFKGRVFCESGITVFNVIQAYNSGVASSQYMFQVQGDVYNPNSDIVLYALGGGNFRYSGKIFCPSTSNPVLLVDENAAGINLPGKIWLSEVEVYAEGTLAAIFLINDVNSRIYLKSTKMISLTATSCINGVVAATRYQSFGGNGSNLAKGANTANALGTTDIAVDALMR